MPDEDLNDLSLRIVKFAIKVHRTLGPGLMENIYRRCLVYELEVHGSVVICEQAVPIRYEGLVLDGMYRLDMLVDDVIIVEVKAVEQALPVHHAQLLSYL